MPQESQWREKEKNQNYTHSRTNNTSRLRKRIKKRVHNMQPTGDKNNHDRTFSDVRVWSKLQRVIEGNM